MDAISAFSKHVIGLKFKYKSKKSDEWKYRLYSGSYINLENTNFWLSAGHVVKDIKLVIEKFEFFEACLIDFFGSEASFKNEIPFFIDTDKVIYIDVDNTKIDWGIVEIDAVTTNLLELNGITAITKEKSQFNGQQKFYPTEFVLGFPDSINNDENIESGIFGLSLVTIINRRFDEEINGPIKRFKWDITNYPKHGIVGMSGGPIFSLSEDRKKYWVIAIQSSISTDKKHAYGFRINYIYEILEYLDRNK